MLFGNNTDTVARSSPRASRGVADDVGEAIELAETDVARVFGEAGRVAAVAARRIREPICILEQPVRKAAF